VVAIKKMSYHGKQPSDVSIVFLMAQNLCTYEKKLLVALHHSQLKTELPMIAFFADILSVYLLMLALSCHRWLFRSRKCGGFSQFVV